MTESNNVAGADSGAGGALTSAKDEISASLSTSGGNIKGTATSNENLSELFTFLDDHFAMEKLIFRELLDRLRYSSDRISTLETGLGTYVTDPGAAYAGHEASDDFSI